MEATIEPITASADGTRNGYTLFCDAKGQRMNYAACLWRQSVLDNPATKVPEDWNGCRTAACSGKCNAKEMRQEELLAGKSIYFECRSTFRKLAEVAKEWGVNFVSKSSAAVKQSIMTEPPKEIFIQPKTRHASTLDALGATSGLAEAITAAATEQSKPLEKPPVVSEPVAAKVSSSHFEPLPGETPLQMARRINSMKA